MASSLVAQGNSNNECLSWNFPSKSCKECHPCDPHGHNIPGWKPCEPCEPNKPGDPCGPGGQPVPEPGTMLLAGTGLAGIWAARRKRKNAVEEIVSE